MEQCLRSTLLCSFFAMTWRFYFRGHVASTARRGVKQCLRGTLFSFFSENRIALALPAQEVLEESNTLEAHCSTIFFDLFWRSRGRHKRCRRKALPSRSIAPPFGEMFAATRLARIHPYFLSEMCPRSSGQRKRCKARAIPSRPIAPPSFQIFAATRLARIHPSTMFPRSRGQHKRLKARAIPSRPIALLFFQNWFTKH